MHKAISTFRELYMSDFSNPPFSERYIANLIQDANSIQNSALLRNRRKMSHSAIPQDINTSVETNPDSLFTKLRFEFKQANLLKSNAAVEENIHKRAQHALSLLLSPEAPVLSLYGDISFCKRLLESLSEQSYTRPLLEHYGSCCLATDILAQALTENRRITPSEQLQIEFALQTLSSYSESRSSDID